MEKLTYEMMLLLMSSLIHLVRSFRRRCYPAPAPDAATAASAVPVPSRLILELFLHLLILVMLLRML